MIARKQALVIFLLTLLCISGICPGAREREGTLSLTLEEAVKVALANNLDIRLARIDAHTGRADLDAANSIFDTLFTAEANYRDDQLEQTSAIFGTRTLTSNYNAGLSKKLSSGTRIDLDLTNTREHSDSPFATINPAHSSQLQISVTQPVARNTFGRIDRGSVAMVKLGIEQSDLTALNRIESSLAGAQINYWTLTFARRVAGLEQEMLTRAENLYRIYQDRLERGLAEKIDLYASEANVKTRRIALEQANYELLTSVNLLTLSLNLDEGIGIEPRDTLEIETAPADFIENLKEAVRRRRDYQAARKGLEAQKIEIVTTKNGLWPEIDLVATFARNGVDEGGSRAVQDIFTENNPDFFLGVNFSWPLENRSARSKYRKALLKNEKALLELKKLEMTIVRELDDRVREVNLNAERIAEGLAIVDLQRAKLGEEEKRIRQGRSNSDTLIRFQDDLLDAQKNLARSFLDYRISRIRLELAKNAILTVWEREDVLDREPIAFYRSEE